MTPMKANRIGFIYPGQGAQHVGMGIDLFHPYPETRKRFDQADEFLNFSIRDCCVAGPAEALNQDLNAQLGVYIISTIITDILNRRGIVPDLCSGYSSGFYAAAYAAGCFDFLTGLSIVQKAGNLLLEVGQAFEGAMAVIFGLAQEEVQSITETRADVDIAIQNTSRQIIVSGLRPAVARVMDKAMQSGALDTAWLPVATAYHSRFMAEATRSLLTDLDSTKLNAPKIPLYSYTTLNEITGPGELMDLMARQLSHPVLWVDLIQQLRHNQVTTLVEAGPGTMLSRTIRWIDRHLQMRDTSTADHVRDLIQQRSQAVIR